MAVSGLCARTPRGPAMFSAFCARRAPDDGQAPHGWPGQRRPIRPLAASLASSCRIPSPCRAAGEHPPRKSPTSRCRLGAARPKLIWAAPLPQSRSVVGRWRAGRRQLMASWALAGVPRGRWCEAPAAAVRGGPGTRQCIGTRSHHPPLDTAGARREGGRPARRACGRAALGRAHLDAPLGRRGAGVARRSSRCAALPPTRIVVCTCGGMPASTAAALVLLPPPPGLLPLGCTAVTGLIAGWQ
jgi:hypothetical protein